MDETTRMQLEAELNALNQLLCATDYKATKHSEGLISDKEYMTIKKERQVFRDKVAEIVAQINDETYEVSVEELRARKKDEVGTACTAVIAAGVDVELTEGTEHFSLTANDQINLNAINALLMAGQTEVPYHADGSLCKYYSATDAKKIVETCTSFVSYNVTYCNGLNIWIQHTDADKLDSIVYGAELPDEYKSEVLNAYKEAAGL